MSNPSKERSVNHLVSIRAVEHVSDGMQDLIKVDVRYRVDADGIDRVETMSVEHALLADFLLAYSPFCTRVESAPLPLSPNAFRAFCLIFKEGTVFTWPEEGPEIVIDTVNGETLSRDENTPCFLVAW